MRPTSLLLLSVTLALGATACGHDFEPPDREARVQEAEAVYAIQMFDSIAWATDSVRALQGNLVYAEMCNRCHGPLGLGDTPYARERGLSVPSLVEPDWALADLDTLRHVIFVSHGEGMPIYGTAGITPRQIDGAAYYVLEVLRPDAAGAGGG